VPVLPAHACGAGAGRRRASRSRTRGDPPRSPEALAAHEAVVDALYRAPDLGEAACEQIAIDNGAQRPAFESCVADPTTDARIDRDTAMFRSLGGDGVPMMYVDRTLLDGAQTRRRLETAIGAALRDAPAP
jgi:protein-disulfide isomerase